MAAGWYLMAAYSYKTVPTSAAASSDVWPAGVELTRDVLRPTLVVFLHPKCPCSRATLTELERVQTKPTIMGRAKLLVVFATPAQGDETWVTAPLVEQAKQIPNAEVVFDRGGVIAPQFGAATSGAVMVYNAAGHRQFAGGVTASRGHEGSNAGADAVASLLAGRPAPIDSIPAFGCRLVTSPAIAATH